MISRDDAAAILGAAINAPSGDNAQPWRFRFEGERVFLFNKAGADSTLYNFRERGSLIGHGTLIENIVIAASAKRFSVSVRLFPRADEPLRIAELEFELARIPPDPLAAHLQARTTNRKPYKKKSLTKEDRDALLATFADSKFHLSLAEDQSDIAALANAISLNERLILENRAIHDFLFGIIRWNDAEEKAKPGMHIKTFELPGPGKLVFRLMKTWRGAERLAKLGFSKALPKQTAKLYVSSAAIGAIAIADDQRETFVNLGRRFERLWLTAAARGISLQPITGLPYLYMRIKAGEADALSPEHQKAIVERVEDIRRIFNVPSQATLAMLFRVGYGPPPSAHSKKEPPHITFVP